VKITVPELSLVVLIGPSGSGKSTFAKQHFKPTEVLSSDFCRGLVSDDENDQAATNDAFDVLHFVARKRLAAGKLTAIDATNVQQESRKSLVALAREFHLLPVAIVFDLPEKICHERNRTRPNRDFGPHVVRSQVQQMRRSLRGLEREGFRHVFTLSSPEEIESVTIERQPLWNNLKYEHGPFDIIGDVHGCFDELRSLLEKSGYRVEGEQVIPPEGRKAVFLGDLVDRGPKIPQVLRLVMKMVEQGTALCVPGNHDIKLLRKLKGRDVQITHGLAESLAQLETEPPEFNKEVARFIDDLVSHYVLDDGKLVVAHAGMKEEMQGRGSGIGKRLVQTRLRGNITIREENAVTALEVMSRFAVNPKWLIYLPPTMSPPETTRQEGLLEHPTEAFAYFRHEGIPKVICEEKHMGSRAVVIVCRDQDAARKHFGIVGEGIGICYTRTGRRFFTEANLENEFLQRVHSSLDAAKLWDELTTDWVCLDCELMPWSAKAQELLRQQYAPAGSAACAALAEAVTELQRTSQHQPDIAALLDRYSSRLELAGQFVQAYRRYCWPVQSLNDLKLAPFHLMASEGAVHPDKPHTWHMEIAARLGKESEGLLLSTPSLVIDLTDEASQKLGIEWWEELTGRGGEGMVVKPIDFIARGRRGLSQPAVKCRGREYLRIIYGPEYTLDENLQRLRSRGLATKRSLALRELALGIEALERFVRKEPLRRVHECVFGVLALESEPVDPRL
jgi:predicted kinase